MELHGVTGAPYDTPNVRKRIPTPYTRQSISVGGGRVAKRTWRDTPVTDLSPGDVVSDMGLIKSIEELIHIPEAGPTQHDESTMQQFWIFRVTNVFGKFWDVPGHQRVYAFKVEDDHSGE